MFDLHFDRSWLPCSLGPVQQPSTFSKLLEDFNEETFTEQNLCVVQHRYYDTRDLIDLSYAFDTSP